MLNAQQCFHIDTSTDAEQQAFVHYLLGFTCTLFVRLCPKFLYLELLGSLHISA
jgi:hypothetical protein